MFSVNHFILIVLKKTAALICAAEKSNNARLVEVADNVINKVED